MYKRDRFVFVSNLQELTCDPDLPLTNECEAYLLSERYITKASIERAAFARARKNLLISDNGNFSRFSKIAAEFQSKGQALLTRAEKEWEEHGKLSAALLKKRDQLIAEIAKACEEACDSQDKAAIIAKQLLIRPHLLIGLEDFTIPVLMMCGLMQPVFQPTPDDIKPYQQKTLTLFTDELAGKFSATIPAGIHPMMVIHAYDYASAYQGGSLLRKKNIDHIAISYGAPMLSNRWITSLKIGRKTLRFGEKLPEKYLVAHSLLLGALHGINREVRVHILGAGSPILLAMSAVFVRYTSGLSIDSTAPFQDAYDGNLYIDSPAFLKTDMYELAAFHLIEGSEYRSTSPFWKQFDQDYPSNWDYVRRKLGITSTMERKEVGKLLASHPALLERHLPFFAPARKGTDARMEAIRFARAGTNYWVLKTICKQVRNAASSESKLMDWVESQADRYCKVADPKWAKAVRYMLKMMQ